MLAVILWSTLDVHVGFEVFDFVAELGGFFVLLGGDGFPQIALEFL